jgi:hypothetical protein
MYYKLKLYVVSLNAFMATLCYLLFSIITIQYIQNLNIFSSPLYQSFLNLTKQYFPLWNSLFNKHHDFYQNINDE